eukprot:gene24237-25974_t
MLLDLAANAPRTYGPSFPAAQTRLTLSMEEFRGSIPALLSYGNLTSIDLSFNAFTGRIPGRLQSWKPLTYLNLQNNKFVGDINDIGALTYSYTPNGEGVSLYLTINRLSGVI